MHTDQSQVTGMSSQGVEWRVERLGASSWVLVISVAIEEISNNLEHRCHEAGFVASFTTKDPQTVGLHSTLLLLLALKLKPVLPSGIGLVPVVGRSACDGVMVYMRHVEWGVYGSRR